MDYFNNKIICDLVEASHSGIMAQLDEACYMVGKVDDKMFLDSLSTKLASHKHFTSRKVGAAHYVVTGSLFTISSADKFFCVLCGELCYF